MRKYGSEYSSSGGKKEKIPLPKQMVQPKAVAVSKTTSSQVTEDDAIIWKPEGQGLLRCKTNNNLDLFFPLELTNKDYLRRIFDIVSDGISKRVFDITTKYFQESLEDFNNDIEFLLTLVTGQHRKLGHEEALHIQQVFRNELSCSQLKLVAASEQILDARRQLFKFDPDLDLNQDIETNCESFARVVKLFDSARSILQCFSVPAAHFSKKSSPNPLLKSLRELELRFQKHHEFKVDRIRRLKWNAVATPTSVSSSIKGEYSPDMTGKQLEDISIGILEELDMALGQESAAHTLLIMRLVDSVAFIEAAMTEAVSEGDVEELKRLEDIKDGLGCLIDVDDKRDSLGCSYSRIDNIKRLLKRSESLVLDLGLIDQEEKEGQTKRLKCLVDDIKLKMAKVEEFFNPKVFRLTGEATFESILHFIWKDKDGIIYKYSIISLIFISKSFEIYSQCCNILIGPQLLSIDTMRHMVDSYSAHLLKSLKYNYRLVELIDMSFSFISLIEAGFNADDFKSAGVSTQSIMDCPGMTLELMSDIGYSIRDLKDFGSQVSDPEYVRLYNKSIVRFVAAKDVHTLHSMLVSGAIGDINIRNFSYDYKTALIYQAQHGSLETISFLLSWDSSIQINAKDKSNNTALYYASMQHKLDVVRLLLDFGADRDAHTDWNVGADVKALLVYYRPDVRAESIDLRRQALKSAFSCLPGHICSFTRVNDFEDEDYIENS